MKALIKLSLIIVFCLKPAQIPAQVYPFPPPTANCSGFYEAVQCDKIDIFVTYSAKEPAYCYWEGIDCNLDPEGDICDILQTSFADTGTYSLAFHVYDCVGQHASCTTSVHVVVTEVPRVYIFDCAIRANENLECPEKGAWRYEWTINWEVHPCNPELIPSFEILFPLSQLYPNCICDEFSHIFNWEDSIEAGYSAEIVCADSTFSGSDVLRIFHSSGISDPGYYLIFYFYSDYPPVTREWNAVLRETLHFNMDNSCGFAAEVPDLPCGTISTGPSSLGRLKHLYQDDGGK
ncbi:MAG: hypothetical protein KOO63_14745 [Bacteroidales bacterium]|nr:hypothetical protein [Candidatus Latescibacterota bacterium]